MVPKEEVTSQTAQRFSDRMGSENSWFSAAYISALRNYYLSVVETMFVMPSLQTAPSREEICILNLAGTRDWVSGASCKESQQFELLLVRGRVTNPIKEPDLTSEIWKQGKEKRWINLKRKGTPLMKKECIWWIRSHLLAATSQKASMISLPLLPLLTPAATGQEYFWVTKPNISAQLTPGVISALRENNPFFPSTTSWHHWSL